MEETNKSTTFTNLVTIGVDRAALTSVLLGVPDSMSVSLLEEKQAVK